MMWRLRAGLLAAGCAVALVGACALSTHGEVPASGATSGGPASAGGSGGASGPAGSGGSHGTATGVATTGSGGASTTSSTSGTGGASVSSSSSTGGCSGGQKSCSARCVDATDPTNGCAGLSCAPCVIANGTAVCAAGACAVGSCDAGHGDCNNDASDGCERDLTSDPLHCGLCSHACAFAHATATCMAGTCQLDACVSGFKDCDNDPATDCETSVTTPTNCGDCGQNCPGGFACKSASCDCNGVDAHCRSGGGGTCRSDGKCSCGGHVCDYGNVCNSAGNNCQ